MTRPKRNHTAAFKADVALSALKGDRTLAELAEKHDVHAKSDHAVEDPSADVADSLLTGRPGGSADSPVRHRARDAIRYEQLEYWLGHFGQIDLLTGLPNRSQFLDRLDGAMARARRNAMLVGVMLLNLDHFKALNQTLGHQVADLVLKKLAERLKDCTRKSDTIARIGGDEFAVILEGLTAKEGAAIATQRLLTALGQPLQLDSRDIVVTATVGVAFFPSDAESVDALLQCADIAMSHARVHNRNTCQFYSLELQMRSRNEKLRRDKIESGLASLTPREREVLHILVAGNANKMIAYMLGTSMRTIENHRAKIMRKMDARSLPELVRMVIGVHDESPQGNPKR